MFEWIKRKRIEKLVNQARQYVDSQFVAPKKEGKIQYSIWDGGSDGHVQFQRWDTDDSEGKVQYSLRDRYDGDAIQKTMQSMSAAAPISRIIKELDASTNMTFVDKMLEHISKRHMRDSDVYKAAQIDRRLFSKIVSDRDYKPAKDTCVAFALALRLTLAEAEDLLSRAGYTLSHSNKRDVVIEYFFKAQIYNLNDINDVLYQLEQKVLGR